MALSSYNPLACRPNLPLPPLGKQSSFGSSLHPLPASPALLLVQAGQDAGRAAALGRLRTLPLPAAGAGAGVGSAVKPAGHGLHATSQACWPQEWRSVQGQVSGRCLSMKAGGWWNEHCCRCWAVHHQLCPGWLAGKAHTLTRLCLDVGIGLTAESGAHSACGARHAACHTRHAARGGTRQLRDALDSGGRGHESGGWSSLQGHSPPWKMKTVLAGCIGTLAPQPGMHRPRPRPTVPCHLLHSACNNARHGARRRGKAAAHVRRVAGGSLAQPTQHPAQRAARMWPWCTSLGAPTRACIRQGAGAAGRRHSARVAHQPPQGRAAPSPGGQPHPVVDVRGGGCCGVASSYSCDPERRNSYRSAHSARVCA